MNDLINKNGIETDKASNLNSKYKKKEENEPSNDIFYNKNKYVFSVNFPELLSSILCKRRHISEPLNVILEKIDKEIEIKSYLRLKEDILIMKEIIFDPKDKEIFNDPYDFEEIYYSIKGKEKGDHRMNTFWKTSFVMQDNPLRKSKTKTANVMSKFTEKFKSLGDQVKKLIK